MKYVKIPCSTSNLGCGFDVLGLALSIHNTFGFEEIDSGFKFIGCDEKFNNKDNLVYTSLLYTLKKLNKSISGVKIDFKCDIPMAGGLGSSSTCVVAGVFGAFMLTDTPIDKQTIFEIATEIEGHPDNASPAIFGGLSASCMVNNSPITLSYDIDERFKFLALVPDFQTLTSDARKVLPAQVEFKDAIYTLSRLAMVLKSFETYDLNILNTVMDDKLHEPYRKTLIHEYDEVKEICKKIDSVCFMISGSGSTLLNVINDMDNFDAIQKELDKLEHKWKAIPVKVDKKGAIIL